MRELGGNLEIKQQRGQGRLPAVFKIAVNRARHAKKAQLGEHAVVGLAGSAEELGKLSAVGFGFFSLLSFCALLKSRVQMQNPILGPQPALFS